MGVATLSGIAGYFNGIAGYFGAEYAIGTRVKEFNKCR